MALVLIGLFGLLALVGILCALDAAWRQSDRHTIATILRAAPPATENAERDLVAALLAGSISSEQYRAHAAALAADEPQPPALQRLRG